MNILCSICLELFKDGDHRHINGIQCGHVFHKECLSKWLESSQTCPECRQTTTSTKIFRIFLKTSPLDNGTNKLQSEVHKVCSNVKSDGTVVHSLKKRNDELVKKLEETTKELRDAQFKLEKTRKELRDAQQHLEKAHNTFFFTLKDLREKNEREAKTKDRTWEATSLTMPRRITEPNNFIHNNLNRTCANERVTSSWQRSDLGAFTIDANPGSIIRASAATNDDRTTPCGICGRFFKNQRGVSIHQSRMHPNEYYSSKMNSTARTSESSISNTNYGLNSGPSNTLSYRSFAITGDNDKTTPCEICGRYFKNQRGVSIHKSRMH